jgi:hypothetical protein
MDWECAQLDGTVTANQKIAGYVLPQSLSRLTYTDPTLMATRQFTSMRLNSAQGAFTGFAAAGVIVWEDINDAVPAMADLPGPLTNCDLDWIVRIVGIAHANLPAGSLLNPNVFDNTHLSKARRRLGSSGALLVVFEADLDIVSVNIGMDVRVLIKE